MIAADFLRQLRRQSNSLISFQLSINYALRSTSLRLHLFAALAQKLIQSCEKTLHEIEKQKKTLLNAGNGDGKTCGNQFKLWQIEIKMMKNGN